MGRMGVGRSFHPGDSVDDEYARRLATLGDRVCCGIVSLCLEDGWIARRTAVTRESSALG